MGSKQAAYIWNCLNIPLFYFSLNFLLSLIKKITTNYPHVTLKYRIVRVGAERGALQTVLVDHQYTND